MTQLPDFPMQITDEELLRRVVTLSVHPTDKRGVSRPRWSVVADRFALGSTYAKQLCRRFGVDPDERMERPR